jgi:hypothetical protein
MAKNTSISKTVSDAIIAACYRLINDGDTLGFKALDMSALIKLADMLKTSQAAREALELCEITEAEFMAVKNIKAYQRMHKLIQAIASKQFSFLESATRTYLSVEFTHSVGKMSALNRKEIRCQSFRSEDTRSEFAPRGAHKSRGTANAQASNNVMSALAALHIVKQAVRGTRDVVEFNTEGYAYKTLQAAFNAQ